MYQSTGPSPVDPSVVGVPFLNSDAIELLSNCCTSKEFDLWQSLGANWTQPVRVRKFLGPSYSYLFTIPFSSNIFGKFNRAATRSATITSPSNFIPTRVH